MSATNAILHSGWRQKMLFAARGSREITTRCAANCRCVAQENSKNTSTKKKVTISRMMLFVSFFFDGEHMWKRQPASPCGDKMCFFKKIQKYGAHVREMTCRCATTNCRSLSLCNKQEIDENIGEYAREMTSRCAGGCWVVSLQKTKKQTGAHL